VPDMSDKLEIGSRLESIFRPFALQQKKEFAGKQRDPALASFVHYTSAEAALKILETKRIWMRNVTVMPDFTEVTRGFNLISQVLFRDADGAGWKDLSKALDDCASGAAAEALQLFIGWWSDIQLRTYITSISEHDESEDRHGRLSMWRAFGETVRVAIVVKFPFALLEGDVFNVVVSPVAYLTKEEVEAQFRTVVQKVCENRDFLKSLGREKVVGRIYDMLVTEVACLKHEGFKEEREWRLIYAPNRWPSPLIESSIEMIKGIPQVVYKIPLDSTAPSAPDALSNLDLARILDHVIIGPASYPSSMIDAFTTVLQKAGVSDLGKRIVLSEIPIRF
jgi:hypothetical protein